MTTDASTRYDDDYVYGKTEGKYVFPAHVVRDIYTDELIETDANIGSRKRYSGLPFDDGDYEEGKVYRFGSRVRYFRSVFQSMHNNNIVPPAVYDEKRGTVVVNGNDWMIVKDGIEIYLLERQIGYYEDNPEYVKVTTDKDGKILYAVKKNGDFYFGAGVPSQIEEMIDEKIG